jgi:tripartite-type tricarboxylate transporter receptor subunit TctC
VQRFAHGVGRRSHVWRLTFAIAAVVALLQGSATAQNLSERTITFVNPYAAGGPADLLARTVAEGMPAALGQTVIVESRAGGGTTIGAASVARARPDGSTLFIGGAPSHIVAPALMKNVGYDGLKDFAPIAMVANVPNVLVVPESARYRTVKALVAAAKESNGAMTFASAGVGSLPQFLAVLLQQRAGVTLTHVPYKGAAPATVDLLAGRIDLAFLNVPSVLSHIEAKKLRALAVANATRAERLAEVPTMAQAGYPDVEMSTWYGISAPAGTPRAVIDRLHAAIAQTLTSDGVRQKLSAQGAEIFLKDPDAFAAYLQADAIRMRALIESANMKAEAE